jgi:hypothetical protein
MALPGFVTNVTLKRTGQTGHADDGTPITSTTTVWTKKGHYQQQQGTKIDTQLGEVEYQVYRFWLPFIAAGSDRPIPGDIMVADGQEYTFIGVEQESLKHHLIVKGERVER